MPHPRPDGAEQSADPVRPNMTPMIDVVFQLIVFFLVSMRFRSLDERLETPLRDGGRGFAPPPAPPLFVDLRGGSPDGGVRLLVNRAEFGTVGAGRDDPAWERLGEHAAAVRRRAAESSAPPVRAEVDASPGVRAGTVLAAVDVLAGAGIADVRFRGARPPQ